MRPATQRYLSARVAPFAYAVAVAAGTSAVMPVSLAAQDQRDSLAEAKVAPAVPAGDSVTKVVTGKKPKFRVNGKEVDSAVAVGVMTGSFTIKQCGKEVRIPISSTMPMVLKAGEAQPPAPPAPPPAKETAQLCDNK